MKINSLIPGLPYFFRRQLHGKGPLATIFESLKPASERDRAENVIEDILRWADEGGKMLDLGNRTDRSTPDADVNRANES